MSDNVFRLHSLDTTKPSKYLLSVYMPVPFGVGKNVFLVDGIETRDGMVTGFRAEGGPVVVQFPDSFQYMLVNRDQYEIITLEEAKKQLKEEEEGEEPPAAAIIPGQYV